MPILSFALLAAAPLPANPTAEPDQLTDIILVTGGRIKPGSEDQIEPSITVPSSDAAALIARTSGAALVGNGPISGQVQYRGLFSDRLAIGVNGQTFQSGGPNAMDPPLHYAPMILVDHISISRGTGPVRDGMGLGGSINAQLKQIDFGADGDWQGHADLSASARSADQSYALGGVAALVSDQWRVQALGAYEKGKDLRLGGGGKALATSFERLNYGLGGGFRHDGGEIALEWRRQETSPSGNPAFAMDIDYFHSDFLRAASVNHVGSWTLNSHLGFARVTHGMNNFGLRPAPSDRTRWRYSAAQAETMTAGFSAENQLLALGFDGQWTDRNVRITNPNNSNFWITSLNRVQQQRLGLFAELRQQLGALTVELGGRYDFHRSQMADPMVGSAVPAMVANLAQQVAQNNAALRNETGDIVLRMWSDHGAVKPRLTLAFKQRVPNAVERHSWMPTEASGGLADGNIYVGDANLRPEKAWIAEAGVDVVQGALRWRPSIFYRRIDDYVQGVPVPDSMMAVQMIAGMNGDTTPLIFANVDAQLYGADMDASLDLGGPWQLQGTLSYVRGKRRDIADNLYRMAPLNGRISLHWTKDDVSLSGELVGAAAQRKVSRANDELGSPSWLIGNIWAELRVNPSFSLALGVENLWDQRAADHLSGINRVTGSDVAVGQRVPMAGRSANVRLNIRL
jgi:iron complex outermembrane receptor protein